MQYNDLIHKLNYASDKYKKEKERFRIFDNHVKEILEELNNSGIDIRYEQSSESTISFRLLDKQYQITFTFNSDANLSKTKYFLKQINSNDEIIISEIYVDHLGNVFENEDDKSAMRGIGEKNNVTEVIYDFLNLIMINK